jgi:hypothetical protein
MADWATISALATAGGTLALAGVTLASVRSANRAARVAEETLLAGLRPLLVQSRLEGPVEKVGFVDDVWLHVPGGGGAAQVGAGAVYLAIAVRNVGTGIAVLHGWQLVAEEERSQSVTPSAETFNRLTRDLYIAPGDSGFWQGALRDPAAAAFTLARRAIEARTRLTIDVLYGDFEGGQRVITRFSLSPRAQGEGWIASVGRHWNVDRPNARQP